jgi:NADPH:quinone reductase-like Zn-dependent oxidoreductase
MKAVFLTNPNEPFIVKEIKEPVPGDSEVLIRLAYSALNHRDLWMQKGQYSGLQSNLLLGSDGFGTIVAAGKNADAPLIGKEVIINPSLNWGDRSETMGSEFKILGNPDPGTFVEYITVDQKYVYPKPSHLTPQEAAGLPLAGLTTFRAVFTRAKVKTGDKVLVTGIGGGTALLALQFALAAGAEVYVTSGSADKITKAKLLGARDGFNYKEEWVEKAKRATGGFDAIIDSASGNGFSKLINVAAPGGRIVFFGGTDGPIGNLIPGHIFRKNLSILGTMMGSSQEFEDMLVYTGQHGIKPVIDKVYPSLEHAQEAFDYMAQGKQFGKIVLTNQ